MALRTISQIKNFEGKTVLVRVDTDVDIKNGKILDDTRLAASLETIRYILKHHGNVIVVGHLGRPKGAVNKAFTLLPVAKWYAHHFDGKPTPQTVDNFEAWSITESLIILENIRFYEGEEKNDPDFVQKLAKLGNIYVDEAFAVSHRNHASITGITKLLPSYAGFHLSCEVEALGKILHDPKRPLVVLIGGAKLETKLPLVETMHRLADYVLVGGKIAEETRTLIKVQHEKIKGKKSVVLVADNTPDGLDITEKDTENFIQIIHLAEMIVWNGPVGKMGNTKTERHTLMIAKAIANSPAYSVVGGGDSLTLLREYNLLHRYSFISTGGGAMLEFLAGKKLPGVKVLEK